MACSKLPGGTQLIGFKQCTTMNQNNVCHVEWICSLPELVRECPVKCNLALRTHTPSGKRIQGLHYIQATHFRTIDAMDQVCNHYRNNVFIESMYVVILRFLTNAFKSVSPTSNHKNKNIMIHGDTCVFDRDEFQEHSACKYNSFHRGHSGLKLPHLLSVRGVFLTRRWSLDSSNGA